MDTHALIWYVYADDRLSPIALESIENAANEGSQIGFSAISLIEIVYLIKKGRIKPESLSLLITALENPAAVLIELPVDHEVANTMQHISREQIPDMPDRIIAATALLYKIPLISRDGLIRVANIQTIW